MAMRACDPQGFVGDNGARREYKGPTTIDGCYMAGYGYRQRHQHDMVDLIAPGQAAVKLQPWRQAIQSPRLTVCSRHQ